MAVAMAPRVLPLPRQHSFNPPTVLNPFVHPGRLSAGDKLRTVLQGIILLPLRAICITCILLLAWLSASIATFCQPGRGFLPLEGWRRRMIKTTLSSLTRTAYFVMGFQVKVKGKVASLSEAPIFVAAPHSSFFDAIICALTGMPSIVSRAENLSTPIFGTILRSLQPVAVSRQDPDSRKNTVAEITRRALSKGQWPQILIFPEGTCTNRTCLITFKQGAFVPRVPVQPVLLRYPNKLDTVTWTWQGYSFKELCIMTLCQIFTRLEVEFLPVHIPTEEEKNDPVLFANRVRQTMANALNVPITDHTFEDCRLMISAGQLTLPMEAGLVEFTKISKKLNLKWNHVREQLDTFAAIASASKGGRIGIEEFAEYLKLPISDVLKELFLLFDRNGDGTIDFREYVIGLSILCNSANTEETIRMAFKLFDMDEDGTITEKEFASIIQSALGLPELDVSVLFKEIDADETGKLSYEEFKNFALKHPEYASLFTTYIDLQRHQLGMFEEHDTEPFKGKHSPVRSSALVSEATPLARNKVCPEGSEEDSSSTSDKKDD
ncbi:Lysophosphatidylcholine acyltransferase 2 [Lonchura striata]|uniref:Lysophosphatidylcholine acyltransferase 2 n=1 Tax=Lonchura striata TaxID=40157 RepID=A0A218UZ32_9PASE|nr:lysophosphatidylcholine acyltransferase 2 [Lonchura striata domestica]OWK58582.1 Lysophosphatidylcholine acyltransferase 2 [Lonchura striata domestica]